jgi:hypothetical protein
MNKLYIFRVVLILFLLCSFIILALNTNYLTLRLKFLSFSNILPDSSGTLPFLVLLLSTFICGAAITSVISGKTIMENSEIVTSFLIGVIIFGILCFFAVYFHFYNYLPYLAVVLGITLFFGRVIRVQFKPVIKRTWLLFPVLFLLPVITLPIYSMDAMHYHAEITRIIHYTWSYPSNFGSGTGIWISSNYPPLFSLFNAFLLSGSEFNDVLLGISNLIIGSFALLAITQCQELKDGKSKLILVLFLIVHCSIDSSYLLQFAFFAMSFYYIKEYLSTKNIRELLFAGILLGGLSFTSYFGIFVIAFFAAFLFRKTKAEHLMVFILVSVLIASPWFLRNAILSGNPVYPFLNQIFNSPYLSALGFEKTVRLLTVDSLGHSSFARVGLYFIIFPVLPLAVFALYWLGGKRVQIIHVIMTILSLLLVLFMPVFFPRYFIFFIISIMAIYDQLKSEIRNRFSEIFTVNDQGLKPLACGSSFRRKPQAESGSLPPTVETVGFREPLVIVNYRKDVTEQKDIISAFTKIEVVLIAGLFVGALSNLFIAPCFFCGKEAITSHEVNVGVISDYINKNPDIKNILAFDMPTYYLSHDKTIVPLDEGFVYTGLSSIDGYDSKICYLGRYASYIVLYNNTSSRSLFLDEHMFYKKSQKLELVKAFDTYEDLPDIYKIKDC